MVPAMPPCSACRRSSWISCGRARGQHRPWPPKCTDTDVDRPTQRDTSGTPGGRGTTSQSPQDPHRAPEMERTQPNPGPRPRACRERQPFRVCRSDRECQPSQSSQPITAHSPGTCAVRPGSSCEGQRSSCPTLHPSPPACSLGTRPHEAPAEARGPKLLTAGPIPYQPLDFHIHPLYHALTTQGADSRPRARVTWGDGPWKAPQPHPAGLCAHLPATSEAQAGASYPGLQLPAVAAPPPSSPGSSTAEQSLEWEL